MLTRRERAYMKRESLMKGFIERYASTETIKKIETKAEEIINYGSTLASISIPDTPEHWPIWLTTEHSCEKLGEELNRQLSDIRVTIVKRAKDNEIEITFVLV